ncbi:MAG: phosphate ABC transporter ATP-binding protein [Myxococcota bacterium]
MTGASIRISSLSAWFSDTQVLQDVSVELRPNRITALIGSTGSGKTTLLRCCNRLAELEPRFRSRGEVLLDDQAIAQFPAADLRRKVGMVFERPTAFSRSLEDNLAFGLALAGIGRVERERRIEAALRAADLFDELGDLSAPAASLDSGSRQLLCIARALALEPSALLLDEPTRWLHPAEGARVERVVAGLRDRVTIILATSDTALAGRLADDVALLQEGRLVEYGATEDVFTAPRRPETEAYLTRRYR